MTKRCYPFVDSIQNQLKHHVTDKLMTFNMFNNALSPSINNNLVSDDLNSKRLQEIKSKVFNQQHARPNVMYKQLHFNQNGQLCRTQNGYSNQEPLIPCSNQTQLLSSCTSCRMVLKGNNSLSCDFCEKLICEKCTQHCVRCYGIFCQLCSLISYKPHGESATCLSCLS